MTAFDETDETPVRPRRRWLIWSGASIAAVLLGTAALVIWAPWRAPAAPIVTALPAGCPALLGEPTPSAGSETGPGDAKDADCSWGTSIANSTLTGPNDAEVSPLTATTALYPTIDEARSRSAALVTVYDGPTQGLSLGADTPIAEIGDEARISDHDGLLILVARKANVVLTMQYYAPRGVDADQDQAVLATAARTILAGISLTTT
ncbi:MAG TPA: hypothetical protein VG247_11240 [Pseudonocardiaceae bacterium]|jgi:hypothetical protein|nr:hypothetical protein [Pseudonocardiaceae bacterium]